MALAGQRIVIIGGSSGMGLATARAAAAAEAAVTMASSDPGRLTAALAQLPDTCDGA
jgi:NAD(P)-dependent dehydrogenase (short-subunit alcohol dehydrogenase family)